MGCDRKRLNRFGIEDAIYRRWKKDKRNQGIKVPPIQEVNFLHLTREEMDQIVLHQVILDLGAPRNMFIFAGASDKQGFCALGLPMEEALRYVKEEDIPEGATPDGHTSDEKSAAGQVGHAEPDGEGPDSTLSEGETETVPSPEPGDGGAVEPEKSLSPGRDLREVLGKEAKETDPET